MQNQTVFGPFCLKKSDLGPKSEKIGPFGNTANAGTNVLCTDFNIHIVLLAIQTLSFWDFSLISTMPSVISYLTKVNMASNITDIGNPSYFWSIIVLIKGCFRSMVLFGQLLCWSKVFFDPWLFSIKSCLLSKVLSYIWGHVPSKIVFCWSKVNS